MVSESETAAHEFLKEFKEIQESNLIRDAYQARDALVQRVLSRRKDPVLEEIAKEYLPAYAKPVFEKVADGIINRIPALTERFVLETEVGETLYSKQGGIDNLTDSIIFSRINPKIGKVDIVTAHLSMTEPMVQAFVARFSGTDMPYTIAGDNLYAAETAEAVLPLLGMCKLRRKDRPTTYDTAIIRINKALYDYNIDRVVFPQDGRGPMGLPKGVNSAILRQYLSISQKTIDSSYFLTTTAISQHFHPDMQDIIGKASKEESGRTMNFLNFFFGSAQTYKDFGERLEEASGGEFALKDIQIYVTLPEIQPVDNMLERLHVSSKDKRYADQVAIRLLTSAYEMTRVMVPDIFARAVLDSGCIHRFQSGPVREKFYGLAHNIIETNQTYYPEKSLRLDPLVESLNPEDLERGFEFGLRIFQALDVIDKNNNIYDPTPLIFYNNKCALHYGERQLKMEGK